MDELLKRINKLYLKSQKEGLTEEEKEEQAKLRKDYVAKFRNNLRAQLDNIDFLEADGTITSARKRGKKADFSSEKENLRREYLARRNALSEAEISEKSRLIIERLTSLDFYRQADVIFTYVSFGSEVRTTELIETVLAQKEKRVFVPKVAFAEDKVSTEAEASGEIDFYEIMDVNELSEGCYGILEPAADKGKVPFTASRDFVANQDEKKCLVILPGIAFDEHGGRIGYGKGYYDRFLKRNPHYQTVALAYESQIASSVPQGKEDIRPMMILTEDRLVK